MSTNAVSGARMVDVRSAAAPMNANATTGALAEPQQRPQPSWVDSIGVTQEEALQFPEMSGI
jgi:hypothetical protein